MTANTEAAEVLGVIVPREWEELPVDHEGIAAAKEALLEELTEELDVGVEQLRMADLLFDRLALEMRRGRVRTAAAMAQAVRRTDADDALPQLVTASVTVSVFEQGELGLSRKVTASALLSAIRSDAASEEAAEGERQKGLDLEPPATVALPAGPSVRTVRIVRATGFPAAGTDFFVQRYLVPFDGGERICALQFATPNLAFARDLAEVFESIARTLRLFRPDDETTFAVPTDDDE